MYGNCEICGAKYGFDIKSCEHMDLQQQLLKYVIYTKKRNLKFDIDSITQFVIDKYKNNLNA